MFRKVAAENERRRRARFEEKRAQQNARNQQRRPRRFENKETAEVPAAAEAVQVAEPVVEAAEAAAEGTNE
jgi:hypothetical protein